MRRISAGFVPVVPLTIAETRDRWAGAENIFLHLLNRGNLQGRNVALHAQATTYAAKVLSKETDRGGMLRSDFEGAMDRLFNQNRIMIETWGSPRKPKQRVVPTPGR